MTIKSTTLSVLMAAMLVSAAGCKRDPEEPESQRSTGDEIEDEADEAVDEGADAIDEATEDLDDDNNE